MFVIITSDRIINLNQYVGLEIDDFINNRHSIRAIPHEGRSVELASWEKTEEGAKKAEFVYQAIINALEQGKNLLDLRVYFDA